MCSSVARHCGLGNGRTTSDCCTGLRIHTHTRASSTFNHHPHLGPSHCSLPTFRTTGYFCIAAVLSRAAQLAQPEEAARRAVR